MERRVVITAASAITPIGHTKKEIVASLKNRVSGVMSLRKDALLTQFIHSQVFGTIDYQIDFNFQRKYRKTMGPVAYYACQVAKEVIEQTGLQSDFITSGRLGVAFGSIHGSPTVQRGIYKTFFNEYWPVVGIFLVFNLLLCRMGIFPAYGLSYYLSHLWYAIIFWKSLCLCCYLYSILCYDLFSILWNYEKEKISYYGSL